MRRSRDFGLTPCLAERPSFAGHLVVRQPAENTTAIFAGLADQILNGGLFAANAGSIAFGGRFDCGGYHADSVKPAEAFPI